MRTPKLETFEKEADLCAAFVAALPSGWVPYPETAGFDLVLVREDGVQIGVEAKLRLNADVLLQASKRYDHWDALAPGPDFRAVLVPEGRTQGGMIAIAHRLGLSVIRMMTEAQREESKVWPRDRRFFPELPRGSAHHYWAGSDADWLDWCPAARCKLPEYVPDVAAGHSAPVQLSPWKVSAIKISILLDKRGWVTRADFKHFRIDASRWTQHWLDHGAVRGRYVRGKHTPDFQSQHPVNFEQILADFDEWKPLEVAA